MNNYSKKIGFGIIRLSELHFNESIRKNFMKNLEFASTDGIKALVLIGQGPNFTNGTDHLEIVLGKSSRHPNLINITNSLENFVVPVIGCLHGNIFGGVALACHWRITHLNAKFSFSDLNQGLITGNREEKRQEKTKLRKDIIFTLETNQCYSSV